MIPPTMGQRIAQERIREMHAAADRARLARQARKPRRRMKIESWRDKESYGFMVAVLRWPWSLHFQVWNFSLVIRREH
jgi:hypothetical protein